MTTDPLPAHILAERRQTLEAFVVRARRIKTHSLLSDLDWFLKIAHGSANLSATFREDPTINPGEPKELVEGTLTFDLPAEEVFESLAARVRPLTLQGERIHFTNVIGAARAFTRGDADRSATLDTLRASWLRVKTPSQPILLGVVDSLESAPDGPASYVDVANAWLYADLVHCDSTLLAQVGHLPLSQRYVAAVMLYGQSACHAVGLLNVLEAWQVDGVLGLDPEVFTEPVAVEVPLVVPLVKFAISPVKPPAPES